MWVGLVMRAPDQKPEHLSCDPNSWLFFFTKAFGKSFRTKLGCLLFLTGEGGKRFHTSLLSPIAKWELFLETYNQKDLQMKERSAIRCSYAAADTVHLEGNVENLYPSVSARGHKIHSLWKGKNWGRKLLWISAVCIFQICTHIYFLKYIYIYF